MRFEAAYPVSGVNLTALPVKVIGPKGRVYQEQLGFEVVRSDETSAVLRRGDVQHGLVRKSDHRPDEAGSCCLTASDIEAARTEMLGRGGAVGVCGIDEWGGRRYRTRPAG